jgi:hypothetical protein
MTKSFRITSGFGLAGLAYPGEFHTEQGGQFVQFICHGEVETV